MDFDEIRNYWNSRAAGDLSAQSTTQDVYLREIEFGALLERIRSRRPTRVADVGCGDGRTTARLASKLENLSFTGFDYSESMVANSRRIHAPSNLANLGFEQLDVCAGLNQGFDLIYTTRCLINLPSWEMQSKALTNIHAALSTAGSYLMVENFVEGQDNFNQVRQRFGLPEIPVRSHNKFFERARLLDYIDGMFVVEEELNISSTYYLTSRVIYARMCADAGTEPDYFDDHHRLAAGLPFAGEFGPVRILCLRKR